ncbi:hypothetical protein PENANT_c018G10380 [Penicillium antarcticum]|uniref:Uncharacterized protein n=1 Tax=Penicillium antarcticum TaxID=416450 RepID=A0A1V6Q194_9EURO|nr:uncharacterized protein N7508_003908 [Penicillium antarcticum]KAJ5313078.1 hypothetical protein N7508_003908 [Penicillium antarcticum]OQD82999.1 hypothetical protein PENANT_c018G10380 [Penicillium antarcticum]
MIAPPRPVSVNSLARAPAQLPLPSKTVRSTSAEIPFRDSLSLPVEIDTVPAVPTSSGLGRDETQFANLPIEIHENILDHIFGERAAASSKTSAQNWSKAFRHPRRKALSNLALICRVWTPLVQSRIYRHIKVKGTQDGLAECARWFITSPHLILHVRHIEVWIPVWGDRVHRPRVSRSIGPAPWGDPSVQLEWWAQPEAQSTNEIHYHTASRTATLEEIFELAQGFFAAARVLTLEGGHCKNPPMVQHFRGLPGRPTSFFSFRQLPVLKNIETLVMRGAWNLMRDFEDWHHISRALPALREWHCSYAQPQPNAYITMMHILIRPPPTIRHLNLTLEGFYNNKDVTQTSFPIPRAVLPPICTLIGQSAPHLESLSFTGRICASFFEAMKSELGKMTTSSRLRSLDIVVKSCCRDEAANKEAFMVPPTPELSGINNMNFIYIFESMVLEAVKGLARLPQLDYIRIRYIDLDSTCPLLNPYFQLSNNECTGLWSHEILTALQLNRPNVHYVELADGIYPQYGKNNQMVGAIYPRTRPQSINAAMYKIIADVNKF